MRPRRRLTVIVFVVCALAVLEGLGWITWQAVKLERRERDARAEAQFVETVHLALWKMESVVTPILAQEAARPYFHYRPFYPADRAYTRMWQEVQPGDVLVPSPLLAPTVPFVRLHFQWDADGMLSSPEAPAGNMRDLAESRKYLDSEYIVLADQWLAQLGTMFAGQPLADRLQGLGMQTRAGGANEHLLDDVKEEADYARKSPAGKGQVEYQARAAAAEGAQTANRVTQQQLAQSPEPESQTDSVSELGALDKSVNKPAAPSTDRVDQTGAPTDGFRQRRAEVPGPQRELQAESGSLGAPDQEVEQGPLRPLWRTSPSTGTAELVLCRTVKVRDQESTQGLWLDWPSLQDRLLAACRPLLPEARLEPVFESSPPEALQAQMLASIPVRLIPGPVPAAAPVGITATHVTLGVTWLAVLGAMGAIGFVLRASMELSDRRGRFVSAVTHELRTPLTTFCLYTEMLADGMVDQAKRGQYLSTLKGESRRLAGVVENVLDYARLGDRAVAGAPAPVSVVELIEAARPALSAQAQRCGMELLVETSRAADTRVAADPRTVERILLNLVDNACKYAGEAEDRRLHLSAEAHAAKVEILFRDHGPGVPRRERTRIFEPFHRARRDAQGPKAGLGLGLALARGLARELGGELELVGGRRDGAEFRLTLPIARETPVR